MATYPAPYLTQQSLTDRYGAETMRQMFDDTNTNTVNVNAVASCIGGAQALTTAWLPDTYTGALPFPAPIPELVVECAFAYVECLAFPRNPDYFRANGMDKDKLYKHADTLGQRIQEAVLRLVDAPEPVPDNVGGAVESNDTNCGYQPKPLFFNASMGDY